MCQTREDQYEASRLAGCSRAAKQQVHTARAGHSPEMGSSLRLAVAQRSNNTQVVKTIYVGRRPNRGRLEAPYCCK